MTQLIVIFWMLLVDSVVSFDFHAHQFILWQGNTTAQSNQTMQTVPTALPVPYNSSYSRDIVMAGFKLNMKNIVMIQLSLQPYSSDSTVGIQVYTQDISLYELSVYVVFVNSSSDLVYLVTASKVGSSILIVTLSPPLPSGVTHYTKPFVRSIYYSCNIDGTMGLHLYNSYLLSTTQLQIDLHYHGSATIHNSTVVTIIYAYSKLKANNVAWLSTYIQRYSSYLLVAGTNFNLPDEVSGVPATTYDGRCLIGIRQLQLTSNLSDYFYRSFIFDARHNPLQSVEHNLSLSSSGGIQYFLVQQNILCLWGCPQPQTIVMGDRCYTCQSATVICETCLNTSYCLTCISDAYYVDSNHLCNRCDVPMPYCIQCLNGTYCLACLDNSYVPNITQCLKCSDIMLYCRFCNSTSYCLQCVNTSYAFDSSNFSCIECGLLYPYCTQCTNYKCTRCVTGMRPMPSQLSCQCIIGELISGLCINIVGCTATKTDSSSGRVRCTQCDNSTFQSLPFNGLCKCLEGTLTSSGCISQVGCVTQVKYPDGSQKCTACNILVGFVATPNQLTQCDCQSGHSVQQGSCVQICGDGILFFDISSPSSCDDGNLQNNDGCSSTCQVEPGFKCSGGSPTSPSSCVYQGKPITVALTSISKSEGLNQGVFTFALSPLLQIIKRMNLPDYFFFECQNTSYSISELSYSGGELTVAADYTQDMEGTNCELILTFDSSLIINIDTALTFQAISQNFPLIISSQQANFSLLSFIFELLSYVVVGLFLLSMVGHKMIGAELMFCSQIVYLSYSLFEDPLDLFSSVQGFKLVTGCWSLFYTEADSKLLMPFTSRVEIVPTFFQSSVLVVSWIGLFGILFIIGLSQVNNRADSDQKSIRKEFANWLKVTKVVYNHCWFPVIAGFWLVLTIAAYTNSLRLGAGHIFSASLSSVFQLITTLVLSSVVVIQTFRFNTSLQRSLAEIRGFQGTKTWYIPLFFLRATLTSILFQVNISFSFEWMTLAIVLVQMSYTILMLWYRPYARVVDNVFLVLVEITGTYAVTVPLLKRLIILDQNIYYILVLVLIGLVSLSSLATLLRILKTYRELACKAHTTQRKSKRLHNAEAQVYNEQQQMIRYLQQREQLIQNANNPHDIFRVKQNKQKQGRSQKAKEDSKLKTDKKQLQADNQIELCKQRLREELLKKRKLKRKVSVEQHIPPQNSF